MSVMIPSVISPEVKSSAERRIFEWFRDAPQTDDWIVLHSLGIANHNKVIYGETDFFVLIPAQGIFAIEVKGGRVKREKGLWSFTNKYGATNSKARGPFDQAKDGVFSIIASLERRLDISHKHLVGVFFGFGVMFPDIEYQAEGIDEEPWQVFDSRDGKNVRNYMLRLARNSQSKWVKTYGKLDLSKLPSIEDIKYIASVLRGDFDYAIALSAQLRNADDALLALTKEQYRCLDQLEDNPRCLIQGPAGTGKTLLAVEEVKKAAACGERVALFCFNSNLAEWLKSYFNDMPSTLRPVYVGTLHGYMKQVIRGGAFDILVPRDENELSDYYTDILPHAAIETLGEDEKPFDKIIVDEAQDLLCTSYLNVFDSCLRKGVSRGCWTFFGDFSRQAIYSVEITGKDLVNVLENITSFIKFKLTLNCRNTKPICEEIRTVTRFSVPAELCIRVEGPPVNYITYQSQADQLEKLSQLLLHLADMHIDTSEITILSPRRREKSVVSLLNAFDIRDFRVPENSSITFSTIQAYKGLENTVIILTDIEDFDSEKLIYVGFSRARSGLYILESESAASEYQVLLQRRLFS